MSPPADSVLPSMILPATALAMVPQDAVFTWYRGEFAAANAIIDELCSHITQISSYSGGHVSQYDAAFAAIHQRRLNWIPVLQMQKYFSIADVSLELRKVVDQKSGMKTKGVKAEGWETSKSEMIELLQEEEGVNNGVHDRSSECLDDDSLKSEITDTGSQELHTRLEHSEICDNHHDCRSRVEQIKMTKGFVAKEPVKGHMVNVVKGMKMYEDIFTDGEMSKLNGFIDELRVAGQNGELLGETYVLFNKGVKGSKREQVQLGAPIFGHTKETAASETQKTNNEPIPALLQSVVDHLVQWHIIPESRKPNGCIINYFDEGEYSQPYLKPPHLDQPLCTMVLSDSTLAFGHTLLNDGEGNFKGHLMLPIKQGSVLVMRNNSANIARHAICSSPSKRASITFYRLRCNTDYNHFVSHATPLAPLTRATTLWKQWNPSPCTVIPKWGLIHAPVATLSALGPISPVMMNHRKVLREGTGVFLPWESRPRKQLPPCTRKSRLIGLPSADKHALETTSDPGSESKAM